jgi:hypoxia up-regulated 1
MILKKAREYATDFAEQSVDAAVVTVPPYFTQAERRAVKRACELANIKLLQLMNDNTAVALNYGIYRHKDFNSNGSTYLFYDMGSQSTICTIATFNFKHDSIENVPQLTIRSVAFDRDLGGLEFQIRLRDYLIKKFHEKYPKIDLYQNSKALIKLFYEAEKAKHVLSANNEYTAQIEGLIDEIDFKQRITREDFENLCLDLFDRVKRPVEEVLQTSGISLVRKSNLDIVEQSNKLFFFSSKG